MNRIYKVIYSKARHCSIVVSEFAKSSHKNSRKGASHTGTPALARILAAALVAGALTWGGVPEVSWAADNTTVTDSNGNVVTNTDSKNKDINANITGKNNKVKDSSNAEIVGDGNTVTNEARGEDNSVRYVRSNDARIHGSGNTISASRNQQVIGDNNTIMGRDDGTVTDYQHPEGREPNVSDLTIGRGNFIRSTDTYRNEWDSLKVIGNNNRADFNIESAGGPAAGIVIGDNQNIDGIKDSIVIGSLSPSEQQLSPSGKPKGKKEIDDLYSVGFNSIIIGYHTKIKQYGEGIVVGNRSQGSGIYETIMGSRSIIGSDSSDPYSGSGAIASIYGAFNKIEDAGSSAESAADVDGVGNSINGSLNITSSARGTMIMGVGNTVTHAKGPDILGTDEDTPGATGYWAASGLYGASYYAQGADTEAEGNNLNISFDEMRNSWQKYMETSGGAVSVFGNSNNVDYAIRSQILGTGNTINGSEKNVSAYNTVSGFANTGTNIKRSAIVGTGNTLKNGEDNVVIGDYHNLENGKHNVILGSMDYTEKQVTKQSKSTWAMTEEHPDGTFEYTVTEQNPVKDHKKDIEDAVMVGYNADVTQNGGVALGAGSIANTEAGAFGWDPKTNVKSSFDSKVWKSSWAAVSVGDDTHTRQITNVAAGFNDTDAVNVAQLQAAMDMPVHIYSGGKITNDSYTSGSLIKPEMTISALQLDFGDGLKAQEVGSEGDKRVLVTLDKNSLKDDPDFKGPKGDKGDEGIPGVRGEKGVKGDKGDKGDAGAQGTAGKDGKDGKDGGVGTVIGDKVNIMVTNSETDPTKPANYTVSLNKEITINKVTVGDTTISGGGLTIEGGPSVTKDGINAGEKKITHVAAGTEETDAVNYGQLKDVETKVDQNTQSISYLNGRVGELGSRINKAAAGSNALAALHPLDYDPDDKADFAVGYGHYRNANAAAVGAFYHPNENTMVNVGVSLGNGDPGFNAGVSFKVGRGGAGREAMSKTEMAKVINSQSKEIDALKKDNADKDKRIDALEQKMAEILAKLDKNGK